MAINKDDDSDDERKGVRLGRSENMAAWRPWRRLSCQDGGEDMVDMSQYRFGVDGPITYYGTEQVSQ